MSAFGLTRGTDLTLAEAENFIKAYFREFPGVKAWLDMTRVNAAKTAMWKPCLDGGVTSLI